jgi:hypothetical protein
LGSQLHAVVAARRLAELFPNRRIQIVFHTAGVTQRFREIPPLNDFEMDEVDDFISKDTSQSVEKSFKNKFNNYLRFLFSKLVLSLGLFKRVNIDSDLENIKPWIAAVSGHYSNLKISRIDAEYILRNILFLPNAFQECEHDNVVAVHYRLGDLPLVKQSAIIDLDFLMGQVDYLFPGAKVNIYTDSEESHIFSLLGKRSQNKNITVSNLDTIETIEKCFKAKWFFGTNSKISFWVTIFRSLYAKDRYSFIPDNLKQQVESSLDIECATQFLQSYNSNRSGQK